MSTCTLSNISKQYGNGPQQVQALINMDLNLSKNSFTCIQGASGSGKSTLLQIIGLLDLPTTGKISIAGEQIPNQDNRIRDRLRAKHIGFVFQRFHLMERLTAAENISLALRIAGKKHLERRIVPEVLTSVGLETKGHRYPSELSGGEQQRVAIARAICKTPTILIADEPTANLDSKTSIQIIELLQHLHQTQSMTILCASHDPLLIAGATEIITLKDGRLVNV